LLFAPTKGTIALIMSTKLKIDQLSATLFGKTRQMILAMLYGHVDESFYLRQITRIAGVGMGAVQRELKALVAANIINRKLQGHQVYYQANRDNPVFKELRSLIIKTVGVGDLLRATLAPFADRIDLSFIYGSIAGGNEKKVSDVDIFIVGNVSFAEMVSVLNQAQETLGREINPTVYPRDEFLLKVQTGHHFVNSVLKTEKIFLIGNNDELERLVKKRLDS